VNFTAFSREVLDLREEDGVRGVDAERRMFRSRLETCAFADKDITAITPMDIHQLARVLARERLMRGSILRIITLVRAVFKEAVVRDLRSTNPCTNVQVKGAKVNAEPPWDWLRGAEQRRLLACAQVPLWFRLMVRVAWGTGLRQGELWNLELKDVHLTDEEHGPHVHVRYGSKGHLPPKNGKVRRTPLFGEGLAGMTGWLAQLKGPNEHGLVFPTVTGCRRQKGAPEHESGQGRVEMLPEMLRLAGITRAIRWHDLRHTCASSLISGTWGKRWELVLVRDMLGHSSIKTTERYAHLNADVLRNEGAATPGHT
jgi:integrase